MKCEIISIGTEILLGEILNTNTQYLSQRLAQLGIFVYYHTSIGDNPERVYNAFENAFSRCDMVITTGGLGPTKDDLTKEQAALFFNKKLVLFPDILEKIKSFFALRNFPYSETNSKQAYFPEGSIILDNERGTAPGCIISENTKILVMLPGPPEEMKWMFEECAVKHIEKLSGKKIFSKIFRMLGIGEGSMAEKINDLLDYSNPSVAPYAKETDCIIRLAAAAENQTAADILMKPVEAIIRERLGNYIYSEGEKIIEEIIAELLIKSNLKIAVAESCTGGMITARLVDYPGISAVLLESCVVYSNEAKIRRLGVKSETLEKFGAVSAETAAEMAEGIVKTSGADVGLAITGIAGPAGGTNEKPVGLVFIGVCLKNII